MTELVTVESTGADKAILKYTAPVNELVTQANDMRITNMENAGEATDFDRRCAVKLKELDDRRKTFVGPLNDVVKRINAGFKPMETSIKQARQIIKTKQKVYLKAEEDRQAKIEAKRKAEAEARALETAETLEKAGMTEEANQVLETAAEAPAEVAPAISRGATGAATSLVTVWKVKITDFRKIPDEYLTVTMATEKVRPFMIDIVQLDGRRVKKYIDAAVQNGVSPDIPALEISGLEIIKDSEPRTR